MARLDMQTFDLVDQLGLAKPDRDTLLEYTHVGSLWFVRAEQNKNEYGRLSAQLVARAREGSGVWVHGNVLVIHEPPQLGDHYQLFLIDVTIGLRLFFKAAGIVLTGRPTGWKDLKAEISGRFPQDHPLRSLMDKHGAWSKALFDDRGDVEHDPYMFSGFQVGTVEGGNHYLFPPVSADGRRLEEVMENYFQDGFQFAEELMVRAIESRLPPGKQSIEIPESHRDPRAPVRFVVR